MDNGKLEKIKIESFLDDKYTQKGNDEFIAFLNPNKYTLKYEIEENDRKAAGSSAQAKSFAGMKPQEIDLEFVLDGTGVTGKTADVQQLTDQFLKTAYNYQGDKHQPRYLRILWGKAFVFDCKLKIADINYTLFYPNGKPLRAKIAAKFSGFVNDVLRKKIEAKESPDITHFTPVLENERIDFMCSKEYDDSRYYIEIARVNNLTNFRKLKTGIYLQLPPLN
jgi:hypothetical protein